MSLSRRIHLSAVGVVNLLRGGHVVVELVLLLLVVVRAARVGAWIYVVHVVRVLKVLMVDVVVGAHVGDVGPVVLEVSHDADLRPPDLLGLSPVRGVR